MNIEIIDEKTVDIYGSTPEGAHRNALSFYNVFIGQSNWKSMEGVMAGISYEKGKEFKYRFVALRPFVSA